jgi:hypothetical protein
MDVDPSLVAVCVVVDKGQEEEEKLLDESLKDGPLQDRVRWVHAKGPSYSSKKVREGTLPVGVPAVESYAREHLLWHSPSAHALFLARLIHQGLVREWVAGWGEEEVMAVVGSDEEAARAREESASLRKKKKNTNYVYFLCVVYRKGIGRSGRFEAA